MTDTGPSVIVYDGECVFCANYVRFLKLKDAIGPVELLDARSDDPRVKRYWSDGYDLNQGMLFIHRGRTYHGDEAINVLAGLSSDLWSSTGSMGSCCPIPGPRSCSILLKLGRRLVLLLRGKKLLTHPTDLK